VTQCYSCPGKFFPWERGHLALTGGRDTLAPRTKLILSTIMLIGEENQPVYMDFQDESAYLRFLSKNSTEAQMNELL
ncbi:hypothetical protein WDW89_16820, partial [Deltaproteobacteria bacterium TL4]